MANETKSDRDGMKTDIRDRDGIGNEDVVALNFIRTDSPYVFRRHIRQGLRSHVLELISVTDLKRECNGAVVEGRRLYPRAVPRKMLRIFRTRFSSFSEAMEEIKSVKVTETYITRENMGVSEEFLVTYFFREKQEILLCGLQEYIPGWSIDPWDPQLIIFIRECIDSVEKTTSCSPGSGKGLFEVFLENTRRFTANVRKMIMEGGFIPDLAGNGNLKLTRDGNIVIVDINNISRVTFNEDIPLDCKDYPVCDKSIEALFTLEKKILGKEPDPSDPLARIFLEPSRMKTVSEYDRKFHIAIRKKKLPVC